MQSILMMKRSAVTQPSDQSIAEVTGKRGQILRELRRQIGSRGIASITIRDLAAASGVATKTLYNLFGSKDALISETIRYTYRDVMGAIDKNKPGLDAFGHLTAYVAASARFNLEERIYSRAAIYAYYSADTALVSFHRDFHDYIGGAINRLLTDMKESGELRPWSPPSVIARQIVECMLSTAAEWARGMLSDEQLVDASMLGVLSLIHGHLTDLRKPETRARIEALSAKLSAEPGGSRKTNRTRSSNSKKPR
jgi:AcrR family transcriptional regulator